MGVKWSAWTPGTIQAGDIIVGLRAGANVAYDATGFMLDANNLSDVASAVTAFNNVSPLTTKGDVIVHNGTNNIRLAVGANNRILIANSATASGLEWVVNPGLLIANDLSDVNDAVASYDNISPLTTKGDIVVFDGTNNIRLAVGANGEILVANSVEPSGLEWIANPGLLIANDLSDVNDAVASYDNISPLTTKGDIVVFDGTNNIRLAVGANGEILVANSVEPSGLEWIANPALLAANDLSDLADVPTALTNLGLSSADDVTFNSVKVNPQNGIAAFAGGGQGSATQLTDPISRVVTVTTAGDSVKLPAAVAGSQFVVINAAAANAMDVFPATGEVINALSANTAISVAANKVIVFYCAVNGTWNSALTA